MSLHLRFLSFIGSFLLSSTVFAENEPSLLTELQNQNVALATISTGSESLDTFLNTQFFEISVWRFLLFILFLTIGWLFKRYLLHRLIGKADDALSKTKTEWDNRILRAIETPVGYVVLTIMLWFATLFLRLPLRIEEYVSLGLRTLGTVLVAWIVLRAIDVFHEMMLTFTTRSKTKMDEHLFKLVKRILRVILIIITVLSILQQWGYHVTSLIAGLGIGGLAVSLAAQDTLANWFGSMMIFTDRPFGVGDWVKTSDTEGIVADVGLRSTRVRTFEQTIVSIPNKTLAAASVENISQREKRRFKTVLGLEYRTTHAQMVKILTEIRTYLEANEIFDQESIYVAFTGFGDSALEVLVYVFINTTDYGLFLETQQTLLLELMRIVEETGTGFAFPSQSIYIEKS